MALVQPTKTNTNEIFWNSILTNTLYCRMSVLLDSMALNFCSAENTAVDSQLQYYFSVNLWTLINRKDVMWCYLINQPVYAFQVLPKWQQYWALDIGKNWTLLHIKWVCIRDLPMPASGTGPMPCECTWYHKITPIPPHLIPPYSRALHGLKMLALARSWPEMSGPSPTLNQLIRIFGPSLTVAHVYFSSSWYTAYRP